MPIATPTTIDRALSSTVMPTACSMNCRFSKSGEMSISIGAGSNSLTAARPRPPPPRGGGNSWIRAFDAPSGGRLDALQDPQLLGFELRLHLVLDRGQPGQERRVALVDRHGRPRFHLRALEAAVTLREHGQSLDRSFEIGPGDVVDRRDVGALRHDLLDRRIGAGAGDPTVFQLVEACRRP